MKLVRAIWSNKDFMFHSAVSKVAITPFNNFTQSSNIDHKKFEMDALRRRLEKNRGEEDAE